MKLTLKKMCFFAFLELMACKLVVYMGIYFWFCGVYYSININGQTSIINIETDSSYIKIIYDEENFIKIFNSLKSQKKEYYDEIFLTTKKIKTSGTFSEGYSSGIWKYYDSSGYLKKEVDYNKGTKIVFSKKQEPFDAVFLEMKKIADSILIAHFGGNFYNSNIKWNSGRSSYNTKNTHNYWFDYATERPLYFNFCYDITCWQNKYSPIIEFTLDSLGQLVIDEEKPSGLIKPTENFAFNITYKEAIRMAKEKGLKIKSDNENYTLRWIPINGTFYGEYQLVIFELIENIIKKKHLIKKYKLVIINPFSKQFIKTEEITKKGCLD